MLLSSSNRKYPPFPLFSYFSVVVCLRCLLRHILSLIVCTLRENREFVFISIVQFMMSSNSRIRFGLQIVFVCLNITPSHYHNCANFIWRHWTCKMPVRYNLTSVWIRLNIFSKLSIIQYMGLCVFSLPISFVMIEIIYIVCFLIIIKSEIWTITYWLGLGHETMVCAVCFLYSYGRFLQNPKEQTSIDWGAATENAEPDDLRTKKHFPHYCIIGPVLLA